MVALKGINKVMSQGNLGLSPAVINRYRSHLNFSGSLISGLAHHFLFAPRFQQDPGVPGPEGTPQPSQPPHLLGQVCSCSAVTQHTPGFCCVIL